MLLKKSTNVQKSITHKNLPEPASGVSESLRTLLSYSKHMRNCTFSVTVHQVSGDTGHATPRTKYEFEKIKRKRHDRRRGSNSVDPIFGHNFADVDRKLWFTWSICTLATSDKSMEGGTHFFLSFSGSKSQKNTSNCEKAKNFLIKGLVHTWTVAYWFGSSLRLQFILSLGVLRLTWKYL